MNINKTIEKSLISTKGKQYFQDVISQLGTKEFSNNSVKRKLKMNSSYIDEVVKIVMKKKEEQ